MTSVGAPFGEKLHCEVVIASESTDSWRVEVESATRGVVLLQTRSVLRDPVRLLQIYQASILGYPIVCVNVVGGGYDFASIKPLLHSLPTELSQAEIAVLRAELVVLGKGVGQLATRLGNAIPNAISVFFNPGAGAVMVDAAIADIVDKLGRNSKLLESDALKEEEPPAAHLHSSKVKLAAVVARARSQSRAACASGPCRRAARWMDPDECCRRGRRAT